MKPDVVPDADAPFLVIDDNGANNPLNRLGINDYNILCGTDTGGPRPFIDCRNGARTFDIHTSGRARVAASSGISAPNGIRGENHISNVSLQATSVLDGLVLESATASDIALNNTGAILTGLGDAIIEGGGANMLRPVASDVVAENLTIRHTSGSGSGVRGSGGGAVLRNVHVAESATYGYILEGAGQALYNCSAENTTDLVLVSDANNQRIIGGHFTGNVEYRADSALGSGVIDGDVTFTSASSNNDLTNCVITGTVTDNGTGNSW